MHELAVTESLLKTATEYALENDAKKVTSLNLLIGTLSGIVDDSVQFYWDMISADTICSQAKLNIERQPAKFKCQSCQTEYALDGELSPCPNCGSVNIRVIAGDEFLLQSIEIEK
ncbi:hydrogenase maturation nickel metallochaperone HypA [Pelolinea submarina]|uniref:Hydrogenase maturation factor HypA n=1 Tax=Pelolinea submarina TaxID=913107 RepID=A0A347ZTR2_9CHLR|nr:hydrogenase maturation nickel metallochaperone HypA [Pelolinea submarina]REG10726.1 hydrogenase-3 nickel incorporation protein HypA [Pelolinea submarina]BBB48693.1 hydrogenase nickel incorporation protein HypA/HybF [Pelolinea submarina]